VLAPVKKTIYSLIDLREIMLGCNRRYLAHLAALDDFSAGVRALDRLTKPRTVEQKTLKGITSLTRSIMPCCTRYKTRGSTSPASAAPTCSRCSSNSLPIASHASFAGSATSA
jgi:hypothetical protein